MRRILVPFDGSPGSKQNLHVIAPIAKAMGAELIAIYVLVLPTVTPLGVPLPAETEVKLEGVLDEADRIAAEYGMALRSAVVDGRAVGPTIVRVAEEERVDAIALALRHTHVAAETLIVGPTVRHVLQHAPCRVLVSYVPSGQGRDRQAYSAE